MSWKRTALFLFILAFIGSLYYFKAREEHFTGGIFSFSREAARTNILVLVEHERIERLTIKDIPKGSEFVFLKTQNRDWQIIQPIRYPAESLIVDGLVSLLKLSRRARQLSFEGLGSDEFGFDKPHLTICVSTSRASEDRCLLIGSDAVIAKGAYAKWEDESKYFLVSRDFLKAFDKTLYSVRKKQIFSLLEKDILSVEFLSHEKELLIKYDDKNWTLEKPVRATVGSEAMNDLLIQLNGLYVKEFLDDENPRNSKLGFEPGMRRVRLTFRDSSGEMLIQGREAKGKDAYYAKRGDDKTVLLISLGKLDKIENAFHALVS